MKKKLLIIDAGHGGSDPGASAYGYLEKELTLPVAKRLMELLKKYNPELTRAQDMTLNPGVRSEIIRNNYEYCISIHFNAGSGSGIETIHSIHGEKGKQLAQCIADNLRIVLGLPLRRVFSRENNKKQDYYYMHRDTGSTTTVIVENLFLDNENDIKQLNLERIARGIAQGFEQYIQNAEAVKEPEKKNPVLRRGDKGDAVKELQKLLGGLEIDGSFGPATEAAVKIVQQACGIKVDGIVGPETWKHLNKQIRPENNYYEAEGAHVVEVDPMDLRISIQDKPGNKILLNNFVTSGYQWNNPDGTTYPLGILASEGRIINNWQPHNKPAGTFLVYKNGTVTVKELLTLDGEKDVWFAVSGCTILPEVRMDSAGFIGVYSDIARVTDRPMLGYNPIKGKAIIAVRPATNIEKGKSVLLSLGCLVGITLDAGGGTTLLVEGFPFKNTVRRLYSVITW